MSAHLDASATAPEASVTEVKQEDMEGFEWEAAKENILPVKSGRDVAELNKVLAQSATLEGRDDLEDERVKMEKEIEEYQGDDPLAPWAAYVKWLEGNYPSDTRKKFAALERCTRELKTFDKYKEDPRYVSLWLQYADMVANPKDIFRYLYANKIGAHVAVFYVGWAWVLESLGNYTMANKVYLKAIQKQATPANFLDKKYREFQRRMSSHWRKLRAEDEEAASTIGQVTQRRVLELLSAHDTQSHHSNRHSHAAQRQNRIQEFQNARTDRPVFDVYADPIGHEPDFLHENDDTNWDTLAPQQEQQKENTRAPQRWTEEPLQHPRESVPAVAPRSQENLQVYADDESDAEDHAHSRHHDDTNVLQQREDREEDELHANPLLKIQAEDEKSQHKSKNQDRSKDQLAYNPDMLRTASGKEVSFEEVRAEHYRLQPEKEESKSETVSEAEDLSPSPERKRPVPTQSVQPMERQEVEVEPVAVTRKLDFTRNLRWEDEDEEVQVPGSQADKTEEITINTRVAMSDVNAMFCSPEPARKPRVSNAYDSSGPTQRKVDFSVFEDSPQKETAAVNDAQETFEVYQDSPEPPPTTSTQLQVFEDEEEAPGQRSGKKRKALGEREDLAKSARVTNRDAILKAQAELEAKREEDQQDSRWRTRKKDGRLETKPTCSKSTRRPIDPPSDLLRHEKAKPRPWPMLPRSTSGPFDPYASTHRMNVIASDVIAAYATKRRDVVRIHQSKLPSLPAAPTKANMKKFRTPIVVRLDGNTSLEVLGVLGAGAFARVFAVNVVYKESRKHADRAIKYERNSRNLGWEFFITNEVRWRLFRDTKEAPRHIFIAYERLDLYSDGSMLCMKKKSVGTLHELVNMYSKIGKSFPEPLIVYYTLLMVRAIDILHSTRVLHGDLKPDNWLVTSGGSKSYKASVFEVLAEKYQSGGLLLIDFGRALDLDQYPPQTEFTGDCHTKGFQCVEMLSGKPWTYQIDTFGICATTHCMLFSAFIQIDEKDYFGKRKWQLRRSFKRYWDRDLWTEFFDTFLNIPDCSNQPSLKTVRDRLEQYFRDDSRRVQQLREALEKQDRFIQKSRI